MSISFLKSLDRALSFNIDAEDRYNRLHKYEDLIELYTNQGIDALSLDYPMSDLINGLLFGMRGVPLQQIISS